MRRTTTPLKRLRLELDRTLRGRAFCSRAIQGRLTPDEYADLITQLGGLVALAGGENNDLMACGEMDRLRLDGFTQRTDRELCATIGLLSALAPGPGWVPGDLTLGVCLTVSSTSWLQDAGHALRQAYPTAYTFLPELIRQGHFAKARLEAQLLSGQVDPHAVHAISELARGAVLGLATYLDFNWRAPVLRLALPLETR